MADNNSREIAETVKAIQRDNERLGDNDPLHLNIENVATELCRRRPDLKPFPFVWNDWLKIIRDAVEAHKDSLGLRGIPEEGDVATGWSGKPYGGDSALSLNSGGMSERRANEVMDELLRGGAGVAPSTPPLGTALSIGSAPRMTAKRANEVIAELMGSRAAASSAPPSAALSTGGMITAQRTREVAAELMRNGGIGLSVTGANDGLDNPLIADAAGVADAEPNGDDGSCAETLVDGVRGMLELIESDPAAAREQLEAAVAGLEQSDRNGNGNTETEPASGGDTARTVPGTGSTYNPGLNPRRSAAAVAAWQKPRKLPSNQGAAVGEKYIP